MTNLRIKGLVKTMNTARRRLTAGIPASDTEDFRIWVTDTVRTVERICRSHGVTPNDLPAPSYRAYRFLKEVDLDDLPVVADDEIEPEANTQIRISNLIAISNDIHQRIAQIATKHSKRAMRELREEIGVHVTAVEDICQDAGGTPANLPTPSQRAYQWLAFLRDTETLTTHIETVAMAQVLANKAGCRMKIPKARRRLGVRVEFFFISPLYRARQKGKTIVISANEGFIGASEDVIRYLICSALLGNDDTHTVHVRDYADSNDFRETRAALELAGDVDRLETAGRYYDLIEVFRRVNARHFDNALRRPRLTWNRRITHRKLGHYQPDTDTVLLSVTLDDNRVPREVIDFVMFHELLHKQMGFRRVNGRRYAHTTAFRERERQFPHYERVQEFLASLGQNLSL